MSRAAALAGAMVAAAVVAGAAVAFPKQPPPRVNAAVAPPPAWIETSRGDFWLAYSSYCWSGNGGGVCADFVARTCRQLPRIRLARGEVVRFHLGFRPTEVSLGFAGSSRPVTLATTPTPAWRVTRGGAGGIFARTTGGDASYEACFVVPRADAGWRALRS